MSRPIHAYIDTGALAANLNIARRHAGNARIWSVVKANAYGHGLRHAYAGLRSTDGFALLDVAEARLLREMGWQGPILLLEGMFDAEELAEVRALNLHVVVHHASQIALLAAAPAGPQVGVYLKVNSGMNRLGFTPAEAASAWRQLRALSIVGDIVWMTHFAEADAPRAGAIDAQLAAFADAVGDLPGERSLSNSAALLRHPAARGDWVRPGIMLYGASPSGRHADIASLGLQAAMTLTSRLISVQQLRAGDAVGYGARFVAPAPMRIGIVACGYADGYPRHAPDGCPVMVDGVRTRMVGQVSMDMICVDLEPVPGADVGSPVELWGRKLPVDDVAQAAGTVGYELLCAVTPRVPMRLVDGDTGTTGRIG